MSRLALARIAPIDRTSHVREPGRGIADIKLSRTAFEAQRPLVGDVPVLLNHDESKVVGRVVSLSTAGGWFVATLEIDDGADEVVRCGTPVSAGLELGQTWKANEWTSIEHVETATLSELSLCRRGMVDGAEIITLLGRDPKAFVRVDGVDLEIGSELLDVDGSTIARCEADARGGAVLVRVR